MEIKIVVKHKPDVPDPESRALKQKLRKHPAIIDAQEAKYFRLTLSEMDKEEAAKTVDKLCREVLSNPVIERYSFCMDSDNSCGGLSA